MTVTINGTTGIAGTNGSAGTPAVQGEDTNTGVFFPAADTVAVSTGGTERVRVTSAGSVGINTTTPNLTGFGGITATLNLPAATNGGYEIGKAGNLVAVFGVEAGTNDVRFGTTSSAALALWTNSTERARIESNGNLLVATTSWAVGQNAVRINGSGAGQGRIDITRSTTSAVDQIYFANPNGVVGSISTNGTSTSYNTSSDYRLKENVAPMQNALATIAQLNPVTYTWKADGSAGQGFIAHELQAVVPDCVTGEKDAVDEDGNPLYQGVDTSFLVATLVKAIQELTARVAELEAK